MDQAQFEKIQAIEKKADTPLKNILFGIGVLLFLLIFFVGPSIFGLVKIYAFYQGFFNANNQQLSNFEIDLLRGYRTF